MAKMIRALIIFAFLDAFYVDAHKHPKTLKEMYADINNAKPQQYLDAHNAIRLVMGVPPLRWDKSLERRSRKYANSQAHICHLIHSHGPFGENLLWELYDEASPHDIVQKFIDEQANYDLSTGVCNCPPTEPDCMCGHFTQVIWKTTEKVGCADVACKGDLGRLVVCSYDPRGNVVGENPLNPLV
ncbi:pathogenesis-related protein 1 [Daucus carota subsp. sativus]|uniref:pathogenesis-related protein 1 n=1 Tax=Daucus carota subsp. sativus TaxID=79200 RepID=UPI0007B22E11|nr:PREDICTED: pathogenesis-related protein 1 [Daucus carota subsp. sativus]